EERRPAASRSDVNAPRSRFELVAALAQRRADALEVRFDAGGLSTSAEQEQIEAVDVMRDEIVLANRAEQIAVERKYRELGTRRKVLGDLEIEVERRAFRRVGMPGHESAVLREDVASPNLRLERVEPARHAVLDPHRRRAVRKLDAVLSGHDVEQIAVAEIVDELGAAERESWSRAVDGGRARRRYAQAVDAWLDLDSGRQPRRDVPDEGCIAVAEKSPGVDAARDRTGVRLDQTIRPIGAAAGTDIELARELGIVRRERRG